MEANLGSIIRNDKARQIIYAAWFVAGIIIGAVQVAYADPDPQWLQTTYDVWSYLGLPIAALATANSTGPAKVTTFNAPKDSVIFDAPAADAEAVPVVVEAPKE